MSRVISKREIIVDRVFFIVQILSNFLFIFGSIVGFFHRGVLGALAGAATGYFVGHLTRWCMGIRGPDPDTGFFVRMRERANGRRRCLLEYFIEKTRGNEFTIKKCRKIIEKYDLAKSRLETTSDPDARIQIINELDRTVKEISYDKEKN